MDQEFFAKIGAPGPGRPFVFTIGRDTELIHRDGNTTVRYVTTSGETIEHVLRSIEELVEGDAPFDSSGRNWKDAYVPLLTTIELAIQIVRRDDPDLKDKTVIAVLERLIARPDMPLGSELSTAIQDRVRLILSGDRYSRRQVVGCLRKVLKSVKMHHSVGGPRGYLDFVGRRF